MLLTYLWSQCGGDSRASGAANGGEDLEEVWEWISVVSQSFRRFLVGVDSPPVRFVGSSSWPGVKSALGELILAISPMTTSWRFLISSLMVDRSTVVS